MLPSGIFIYQVIKTIRTILILIIIENKGEIKEKYTNRLLWRKKEIMRCKFVWEHLKKPITIKESNIKSYSWKDIVVWRVRTTWQWPTGSSQVRSRSGFVWHVRLFRFPIPFLHNNCMVFEGWGGLVSILILYI